MDWQFAAVSGICTVVIIPLIKWLISDWYKKSIEIQKLKQQQTSALLDRFQRDINSLAEKIRNLEHRLNDFDKSSIRMETLIKSALESAERISNNLDTKVRDRVRSEVLQLKDDLLLLKTKREQKNGKP